MKKLTFSILLILFISNLFATEVHELAKAGNLEDLKVYLIENPTEFDQTDERESTPIHFACDRNYLDIVKFLVDKGADINKQDTDGDTPLIWAIARNNYHIAKYLVENGSDVNILNNNHVNALIWAVYRADAKMTKLLIDNGIDLVVQDYEGNTALHLAGIYQRVEIAKLLIDSGADLTIRESRGRTPLVLTAREHGNLEIIRYMIENGADINSADNYGSTALELSAWRGYEETMNYLLEKGAEIPDADYKKFHMANFCCQKSLENLYLKLDEIGVFDRILQETDKNLFSEAAKGDSPQIINWLCEKKFAINEKDYYGWTPLHYAAENGNLQIFKTLIENGADADLRNSIGETAFNIAQSKSNKNICNYLQEAMVDISDVHFPKFTGDYMGQNLPGNKPKVFALGVVSSKHFHHSPVAFSPDGNLAIWPNDKPIPGTGYTESDLFYSRRIDNSWTYPQPIPFTSDLEEGEPFFSVDGKRIYFISTRSTSEGGDRIKENIWYVEVYEDGFSSPSYFDRSVNSNEMHWQFSIDEKDNVYIGSSQSGGFGQNDIYVCRNENGEYLPAENLGDIINTSAAEFNPIISDSGDYLIFTRIGSYVNGLFISFKQEDGSWTEPHSMNDITLENSNCAMLSPDEKFIFFLARENENQGIYWVRIDDYINALKEK